MYNINVIKKSERHLCKTENSPNGEITKWGFDNPHPRKDIMLEANCSGYEYLRWYLENLNCH